MLQATMSYFRDVLGMEAGAAARAAAPVQQQAVPAQPAAAEVIHAHGSGSPAATREAEAVMQKQRQLAQLLQECVGLPTPNSRGSIVALGADW